MIFVPLPPPTALPSAIPALALRDPFAEWLFGTRVKPGAGEVPGAVVAVTAEAPPLVSETQARIEAFRTWAIQHMWEGSGAIRSQAPPFGRAIPPIRFGGNPVPDLAPISF